MQGDTGGKYPACRLNSTMESRPYTAKGQGNLLGTSPLLVATFLFILSQQCTTAS